MGSPKLDGSHYTYKDYVNWPETERWQIINGQPLAMTALGRRHQKVLVELLFQVRSQLSSSECEVYVAPFDVRLPEADEKDETIDTIVQPDLFIVCDKTRLDDKGLRGAPAIIFEILSDSTAQLDQTTKLALYEKHGVKEYCIIHPVEKVIYVRYLQGKEFGKARILTQKDRLTLKAVAGVTIDFGQVLEE